MNSKNIILTSMMLAGAFFSLASCQSEEDFGNEISNEVLLSVTVDRAEQGATRTAFSEINGNLYCVWTEGDNLIVTNKQGENIGSLALQEPANGSSYTSKEIFEGKVTLGNAEELEVNLIYLGNQYKGETTVSGSKTDYDISVQDGTIESLSNNDILFQSAKVQRKTENTAVAISTSEDATDQTVYMNRGLAYGKFKISSENLVPEKGDKIEITGVNLITSFNYYFASNTGNVTSFETDKTKSGKITITLPDDTGIFYVAMFPSGDVTPTFTTTAYDDDNNKYVFTGSLDSHTWQANQYVTADAETAEPVVVNMYCPELLEADGRIFGIRWAPNNDRSWLDCDSSDDNVYLITYIPGVSPKDQGLSTKYVDEEDLTNSNINTNIYNYQWNKDFGFKSTNRSLDYALLPNCYNIPLSWEYNLANSINYYFYNRRLSQDSWTIENDGKFEYYCYPNDNVSNDWSTETISNWNINKTTTVAPKGFRLPSAEEFTTLLPEGVTKTYDLNSEIEDGNYYYYPFYVKPADDGSSVIWYLSYSESTYRVYLDIKRINSSITLSDVTKEIIKSSSNELGFVRFYPEGYRSNGGCLGLNTEGYYWSCDSHTDDNEYAQFFYYSFSNEQIKLGMGGLPKKWALSVRCVYDE